MIINAVIVEDEKPARDLVRSYLKPFKSIEIKAEYADGFTGTKGINKIKPHLVFLDVQMPKISGFELLELLDHQPEIIFTTAYDQYALKAFEMNAIDYLLKPFSKNRFEEAVKRAINRIVASEKQNDTVKKSFLFKKGTGETINRIVVKSGNTINVIPVDDVIYFEAQDDYVMIYTQGSRFLKQQTMKFFEESLPGNQFIRVHRSFIVRIEKINKLEQYGKESYKVIMNNNQSVPVSRSGYARLKEKLGL